MPYPRTMSNPARPEGVPVAAVYVPGDDEWELGARSPSGEHVGDVTWWRRDGSLVCKSRFDDQGKLDGVATRFHPDGTVSMESRYVHGTRWGKTWHSRSKHGDSPEDVHMAALPDEVHRLELVYVNGQAGPIQAVLGREGADAPPEVRMGRLVDCARDAGKYLPGTVFMAFGTIVDIADRRVDADALFFRGLGTTDGSMLRFGLSPTPPPGVVPWQDPNATVLETAKVADRLVVGVDFIAARVSAGRMPTSLGVKLMHEGGGLALRDVPAGSLGQRLCLAVGDRLETINGRTVHGVPDYLDGIAEWDRAGALTLVVARAGKRITVEA